MPFRANGLDWVAYYQALFTLNLGGIDGAAGLAVLAGLAICFFLPNLAQVFQRMPGSAWLWHPRARWFAATSLILTLAVFQVLQGEPNEFIYFEF